MVLTEAEASAGEEQKGSSSTSTGMLPTCSLPTPLERFFPNGCCSHHASRHCQTFDGFVFFLRRRFEFSLGGKKGREGEGRVRGLGETRNGGR
eukprot:2823501-Rhodomonas_salina.2